jgi:hypothetical protein
MQDAVLLANHLYDIKPTSYENIKKALCEYKEERFGAIKDQYPQSYTAAKLIYGHVSLGFLPCWNVNFPVPCAAIAITSSTSSNLIFLLGKKFI